MGDGGHEAVPDEVRDQDAQRDLWMDGWSSVGGGVGRGEGQGHGRGATTWLDLHPRTLSWCSEVMAPRVLLEAISESSTGATIDSTPGVGVDVCNRQGVSAVSRLEPSSSSSIPHGERRTGPEPEEEAANHEGALVGENREEAAQHEEDVVEEEGLAAAEVVVGVRGEEAAKHGPEDGHGRRQLLLLCLWKWWGKCIETIVCVLGEQWDRSIDQSIIQSVETVDRSSPRASNQPGVGQQAQRTHRG